MKNRVLTSAALLVFLLLATKPSLAEPAGQVLNDPVGPARSGAMQCYTPNAATHTCSALAEYRFEQNGEITNPAAVMVQSNPLIVMHSTTRVVIRDHKICGRVLAGDADAATFEVNGAPASEDATVRLRQAIRQSLAELGEVCSLYTSDGAGGFTVSVDVDSVAHPEMAEHIIWVAPADGYRVAP